MRSTTPAVNPRKGLRGNLAGTLKVATLPRILRSYTRPRQSPQRVAREPCGNPKVATLPRVRALDHANPRKWVARGAEKLSTLPRVRALDHANPRTGLRVAPKSCKTFFSYIYIFFLSFSPAHLLQLYLAFGRSITPIHANGCASRRKFATLPLVRALDHANPRKGLHS